MPCLQQMPCRCGECIWLEEAEFGSDELAQLVLHMCVLAGQHICRDPTHRAGRLLNSADNPCSV